MMNGLLSLEHVGKSFDHKGTETIVLKDITISFTQGICYAIMGVSGTGKSTLIHIASGIDYPSTGSVVLNGKTLSGVSHVARSQLVTKTIGVAFQKPYLIGQLNVLENVALPGLIVGHSRHEALSIAQQLLAQVGLTHKESSSVVTLSGGQQQRVALARALYHKPLFFIADEPTGNLDAQTAGTIVDLIVSFCTEFGIL